MHSKPRFGNNRIFQLHDWKWAGLKARRDLEASLKALRTHSMVGGERKAAGISRLTLPAVLALKLQQETLPNQGMVTPVTVGKSMSGLNECFPWWGG